MPCAPAQCPPRHAPLRRFCALLAFLLAPLPGHAEQLWFVETLGLKVGEFRLAVTETETRYAGRAVFRTTGLADLLAGVRVDLSTTGIRGNTHPRPHIYQGDIHTGRRQARAEVDFSTTPPRVLQSLAPPASPITPAALAETIDPLTLLWLTLRDQKTVPCPPQRRHFDGTRVASVDFPRQTRTDRTITCHGTYRRLFGYSAEELSERQSAPLSVTYQRNGLFWRATRLTLKARHGRATLIRQD
ncbi:DUF3108 domain-containing protein [Shimia aestuarii]|uniref:DUF3108 domain-containing protein n=1 Tax=Shimia aestuarii TaxID=254406 RepID=UPI001FB2BA3C|nr:DUF3108 domain-containing protein [Shimia aestuarii]